MHSQTQISIIIPTTKDRTLIFEQTLANAIKAIEHLKAEILIINDSPGYLPPIPSGIESVILHNNPGKGVASARNFGANAASSELLLFLDNDIIISQDSVNHILKLHHDLPDACINLNWVYPLDLENKLSHSNFGKFLREYNMTTFKGWYNNSLWEDNALFCSESMTSQHLSISKKSFAISGGYNTMFPYSGCEDYDFNKRLNSAGLKIYIDTRITVFHNESDKVIDINTRLNSLEMRSMTRKISVGLGYANFALEYTITKKILLNIIYFSKGALIRILNYIDHKRLYKMYVLIVKVLEASVIFNGYNRTQVNKTT